MAPQPPKDGLTSDQIRTENADAITGADEDHGLGRGEQAPLNQGQSDDPGDTGLVRQEPIARSPHDEARAAIASRFRREEREEDERPFSGDFSDNENVYGELGQPQEQLSDEEYDRQVAAREAQGQQPQRGPKKGAPVAGEQPLEYGDQPVTRIVRGKAVTKSVNEWLDDATRVTAGDSYLEETRRLLEDAKQMRAGRAAPDPQHPEGTDTRTHDLNPQEGDPSHHPETSMADLVQRIQFGDPEEAGRELQGFISSEVKKAARTATEETALQRSFDQDLSRSKKALKTFADANQDLANDEIAAMAIERGMYKGYREDIKALGIDESQIPTDNATLANWHRFYRIHGYEVRDTSTLLNASKDNFLRWRNNGQSSPKPATRKAAPTVQVNVQRDDRRMNIPVQPTRGVTPRRDAVPNLPLDQSRSAAVAQIARSRGQRTA